MGKGDRSPRSGDWGQGSIERLPSGSLRVSVFAGKDPIRGTRHFLRETVPKGPNAERTARQVRTRLRNQVNERKNPQTNATLNYILDRWLEVADLEDSTRRGYVSKLNKHVRPYLGEKPASRVNPEALESLYADARRCRDHCDGAPEHGGHPCQPLADNSIRALHFCLSAAYKRAIKWGWLSTNPAEHSDKPSMPRPQPQPPSPEAAAQLLNAAWNDGPDWGSLVWLAMTTGARRAELCALHWEDLDLDRGVLTICRALYRDADGKLREKATKTHQHRRVVLAPDDLVILGDHRRRQEVAAGQLGCAIQPRDYIFAPDPSTPEPRKPDSVTQRYNRLADRLDLRTSIKQLRNYSATELIAAGADARTVGGRLGHGSGGATTLKVYAAWLSEADQRAAKGLAARMPALPEAVTEAEEAPTEAPRRPQPGMSGGAIPPYERITNDLRGAITCGALPAGAEVPSVKELAARYAVASGTAHRAIAALAAEGLITASRGKRPRVV